MARSYARGEWPAARWVFSSPGDIESKIREIYSSESESEEGVLVRGGRPETEAIYPWPG
jgi:hypothetical protein